MVVVFGTVVGRTRAAVTWVCHMQICTCKDMQSSPSTAAAAMAVCVPLHRLGGRVAALCCLSWEAARGKAFRQ